MAVALFDLDQTLIAGDSDSLWGQYLAACGAVDSEAFTEAHHRFHQDYLEGRLDIDAFLAFALRPLAEHPEDRLRAWRAAFVRDWIEPLVLPAGEALIEEHRRAGHHTAIVTATNRFVTAPIAERLGVDALLATEPERRHGRYTGRHTGTPTFREGKIRVVDAWLQAQGLAHATTWFYSDSQNDLPLLRHVDHPVAVDPDGPLRHEAQRQGWPLLTLRASQTPSPCPA